MPEKLDFAATHSRYTGRPIDQSLGHRKIGKTTVDCGFLSSKSQWGNIGDTPTAMLRLALNFHEPADHKLSSAEAHLCFLPSDTGTSPIVTEHLYPDVLYGPPISQQKYRKVDIQPAVEAMGTSVGIGGLHYSAEWSKTLRWLLRGSRLPDEHNMYTRAEWSWQANKLNEQSELKRAFQLALVLADSEQCINVTVTVKGKLQRGWRRYKFGHSNDPPKAVQVQLSPQTGDLAPIIDALAAEIERLNTLAVPAHTVPATCGPAGDSSAQDEDALEAPPLQLDV